MDKNNENMSEKEMQEYLDSILNESSGADNTETTNDTDGSEETEAPAENNAASEEDNSPEEESSTEADGSDGETEDSAEPSEDNETVPDEDSLEANFGHSEDEAPPRKAPKKKKRKKKKKGAGLVFALILTTLIICVSVFIAVTVINVVKTITGLDREDVQIVVEIPENSTAYDIADILETEGVIDNADLFGLMAQLKGVDSSFSAGSHVLSPNMTYSDIMDELCKHYEEERESVDITFPEGITVYDAAALLEENGVCEADRFIYIFNSSSFGFDFEKLVTTSSEKFLKMEGYLFPDTYTFYKEEEPEVVAKKFYRNFENKLTPDYYGRMEDLGLTLEETITLASMVQAEAQSFSDMKKISSVFQNRLKSKDFPRLESDPTTKYVNNVIKPNIEIPDEQMFTAYDTYKGEGLPPGPICNPGLDAISAVLYPADTDYYFFCADLDTGEVFYAETLEEHEANLVKANLR
ncbi:MAG: endolytic transglycosylase MltG [Oscillospiraceae bacterium]|nr:endolytic transglycosylase MltG [Oscillospiraceae bacterium]MDY2847332.1 endolytic transglycosylase MltG [Oscillospiraceae bacterium]